MKSHNIMPPELTEEQGKQNLCAAFYGLDGKQSRHKFAQYFSQEQQEKISGFNLEETLANDHYTIDESIEEPSREDIEYLFGAAEPIEKLKSLLKNDEASEFIANLIAKIKTDMSSCLEVEQDSINNIIIRTVGKEGDKVLSSFTSSYWHQDPSDNFIVDSKTGESTNNQDVGIRLTMALIGRSTLFSDDNPQIYIPSNNSDNPAAGVDTKYINNIEEALPGEVAVFSMGTDAGAAHTVPTLDGARLFVLLECSSCPAVMNTSYKTHEIHNNDTYIDPFTLNEYFTSFSGYSTDNYEEV